MKSFTSNGTILVSDKYNITYAICNLIYIQNEDDTFKYIFKPNYNVISLLNSSLFQGIPGLNLDLRKEEYIRDNILPVFISERVPSKNREDYSQLLSSLNMEYMDPIEYLDKTKLSYFGDNLFLKKGIEKKVVNIDSSISNNTNLSIIKTILNNLALGNDVIISNKYINDDNRKEFFDVLYFLYSRSYNINKELQNKGVEKAKIEGKYLGRKPIKVDMLLFNEINEKIKSKEINISQGLSYLNISKDKYYRLRKQSNDIR